MLLGTKKTFHDHIAEALLDRPMTATELRSFLEARDVTASVQGIYLTLRELIAENVVIKQKKVYSISNVWTDRLSGMLSRREPFQLLEGEEVSYKFKSIEHSDAFWKHMFVDIEHSTGTFPIFHFLPHQFWVFVPNRSESEIEYYRSLDGKGIHGYSLIGGETPFDKGVKTILGSKYHQVHVDADISFSRRDHLSVIGSYVITTRVSAILARTIDDIYKESITEQELKGRLEGAFRKSGAISILVENNAVKAKTLRRKISKDFHIPKTILKEHELF
jgi:hypothetical protein